MRPFDDLGAINAVKKAKYIIITESSAGHFGRIVREVLSQSTDAKFIRLYKPAEGITAEDISEKIREVLNA